MQGIVKLENHALESLEEADDDRLSLCNFIMDEENNSGSNPLSPARNDHLFEFLPSNPGPGRCDHNDIVFCGKLIPRDDDKVDDELNEYQKRDYFSTIKSQSFRRPSIPGRNDVAAAKNQQLSISSARFSGENYQVHGQGVNITSLTSMSAKSKRWMFMFGPVKFKPEMELHAIKQRQARLAPVPQKAAMRSSLTSMLARSFSCIPVAARVGGAN